MAFETKVFLVMMANMLVETKNVKKCYRIVAQAANVEGITLPSFEELEKELNAMDDEE